MICNSKFQQNVLLVCYSDMKSSISKYKVKCQLISSQIEARFKNVI